MKLRNNALFAGVTLIASAVMTPAFAEGLKVLPVTDDDYKPEAVFSIMGGSMDILQEEVESDFLYGVELSFRCILLQAGDNQLRQQLSVTNWEKDGLTLRNIELNAHYQIPVASQLKLGFGPGVGLVMTDSEAGDNPTAFGGQLGVSAHYSGLGPLFLGAEMRYQLTNSDKFGGATEEDDLNNWRVAAKVGYAF